MENRRTPVTVIGLGMMGQALAGAFLREGHPTTVWNRTAAKADRLVAEGAELAGSVGEAVAASPLVVVCVSDYDALHELSLGEASDGQDANGRVLEGRVLVNLSSGTSAQARETAAWAERQGAAYLDGAIMAVPEGIGTADSAIVYSGPRSAFDAHEATLAELGAAMHLGDDHGLSALHEVAVLSLMWSVLNGFLHGAALVGTAGVDATSFTPLATMGIETVTGWLSGYAQQIDNGKYPALDSTLDTHVAAMEHVVHESDALGVNAELPRFVKALADRAVAAGRGGDGYAAMIEQFRRAGAGAS
ncbi:NAD(P)-dependent oxidoreductase [Spirillospora sp. NPDC048911]|uniref:NAD(P)-dependent oxidoreductase n=1 Tax=Spirillospora sp. NPDC048911 TaxID=3364527 RepID=UPI00371F18AE